MKYSEMSEEQQVAARAVAKARYYANRERNLAKKKEYWAANRVILTAKNRRYYEENREQIGQQAKLYRAAHRPKIAEASRAYYQEHKEELAQHQKKYAAANVEKIRVAARLYAAAHKEVIRAYQRVYKAANRTRLNEKEKERVRALRLTSPEFVERERATGRRHYERHPERAKAKRQRQRPYIVAYRASHKEEWKAYNKAFFNRNPKRLLLVEAKSSPCADCGRSYPTCVMDFDHVRGVKEFELSRVSSARTMAEYRAEMAKCDIVCSNCHRSRTVARKPAPKRVSSNRQFLTKTKAVPCQDCGQSYSSSVMDFDHVRGPKRFEIGANSGKPRETLLAEIAKCEVVCSNCHRLRTDARRKARAAPAAATEAA